MYFLLTKKSIEMIELIKMNNYTIPYSCDLLLDDDKFLYDNNILNQCLKKEYGIDIVIDCYDENISLLNLNNVWFIIIIREDINHLEIFISSFRNKEKAYSYINELNN